MQKEVVPSRSSSLCVKFVVVVIVLWARGFESVLSSFIVESTHLFRYQATSLRVFNRRLRNETQGSIFKQVSSMLAQYLLRSQHGFAMLAHRLLNFRGDQGFLFTMRREKIEKLLDEAMSILGVCCAKLDPNVSPIPEPRPAFSIGQNRVPHLDSFSYPLCPLSSSCCPYRRGAWKRRPPEECPRSDAQRTTPCYCRSRFD
mmetsp:Transcript_12169/g.33766  ORF Transcript_12169/g.33766 Transcript_12169/m.33766 type:complete len:201 (-) Transcript_12169:684-1286(-)